MTSFFFNKLQLTQVLRLICDSYISWNKVCLSKSGIQINEKKA